MTLQPEVSTEAKRKETRPPIRNKVARFKKKGKKEKKKRKKKNTGELRPPPLPFLNVTSFREIFNRVFFQRPVSAWTWLALTWLCFTDRSYFFFSPSVRYLLQSLLEVGRTEPKRTNPGIYLLPLFTTRLTRSGKEKGDSGQVRSGQVKLGWVVCLFFPGCAFRSVHKVSKVK